MMYTIDGELYHHGILGMKWGQRNGPPYPIGSSGHSASERKAGWRKSLSGDSDTSTKKKKTKERVKTSNQNGKKTTEESGEIKELTYDERKAKALKSGSAADILQFKGDLTNQQMQEAINRINLEKQLGQISAKDIKTASDKVDDIMNKIDKGREWTQKGVNAYNMAAKIINAFSDEDNLPIIGQQKQSKQDRAMKDLDVQIKKLQVENNKLKNEGEKLKNNVIKTSTENNQKKAKEEAKQAKQQAKKEKQAKSENTQKRSRRLRKPSLQL